jgi:tubulin monoglycylase TTLL3/8
MALDAVKSVYYKIDPFKRINTFELFGLDYMLDEEAKPWLIEINANPCLEISCSVLNRIIPALVENIWKVAIDPLYPPPTQWPKTKRCHVPENPYNTNKFELIFD